MTEKKKPRMRTYVQAFVFGVVAMVIVYWLFQATGNRNRAGSTDDTSSGSGNSDTVAVSLAAGVVQTAAETETPSPSVFLGVEVKTLTPTVAEQLGLPSGGLLVNSVVPNSPADAAGLVRGDAIIRLDKSPVENVDEFREVMLDLEPGDDVRIVYVRDDKRDSTYAELVAAITPTAGATDADDDDEWGIALSPLNSTTRSSLGIPADITGVVVASVKPGSIADQAGVESGDVIMGVDKTSIANLSEFFNAIQDDSNSTALLDIYRQSGPVYIPIDSTSIRLTGGAPFSTDDDDDEEGPKGGKFAQDDIELTADNTAFNRPGSVPGDTNTGGSTDTSSSSTTGMNRPSQVPSQSGSTNDVVLFIGLLVLAILYFAYREYHRPLETAGKRK